MAQRWFRRAIPQLGVLAALSSVANIALGQAAGSTPQPAGMTQITPPGALEEPPAPPPPPAAVSSSDVPPPPPVGGAGSVPPAPRAYHAADGCTPSCRAGFTCHDGQCISACNPACGAGETCTSKGECVATSASPPPAVAADGGASSESTSYPRVHDDVLVRVVLGMGGAGAEHAGSPALKLDWTGGAGFAGAALGFSIAPNLILLGGVDYLLIINPKVKVNDKSVTANDSRMSFLLLSLGVSYYVMPLNLYLSGSLGLAAARSSAPGWQAASNTGAGLGLQLDVGKEWWVSADWGMGVALRFTHAGVPSGDGPRTLPAGTPAGGGPSGVFANVLSVLFSATYN